MTLTTCYIFVLSVVDSDRQRPLQLFMCPLHDGRDIRQSGSHYWSFSRPWKSPDNNYRHHHHHSDGPLLQTPQQGGRRKNNLQQQRFGADRFRP